MSDPKLHNEPDTSANPLHLIHLLEPPLIPVPAPAPLPPLELPSPPPSEYLPAPPHCLALPVTPQSNVERRLFTGIRRRDGGGSRRVPGLKSGMEAWGSAMITGVEQQDARWMHPKCDAANIPPAGENPRFVRTRMHGRCSIISLDVPE